LIENFQILFCYVMFLFSMLLSAFVVEHVLNMEEVRKLLKLLGEKSY